MSPWSPPSRSNWLHKMLEGPFVASVVVPVRGQQLSGLGQSSLGYCICSELASDVSLGHRVPHRQDSWIRPQGVETGRKPLSTTPGDPPQNVCASFPGSLTLCWPRDLSSKGRDVSIRRHKRDSTGLKIWAATWPFQTHGVSGLSRKEGSYCAGWGD